MRILQKLCEVTGGTCFRGVVKQVSRSGGSVGIGTYAASHHSSAAFVPPSSDRVFVSNYALASVFTGLASW